jgi:hypothetical protein
VSYLKEFKRHNSSVTLKQHQFIIIIIIINRESVVDITTRYGLDGPRIEFSAAVYTGPAAHRPFCKMGTGFLSRR